MEISNLGKLIKIKNKYISKNGRVKFSRTLMCLIVAEYLADYVEVLANYILP